MDNLIIIAVMGAMVIMIMFYMMSSKGPAYVPETQAPPMSQEQYPANPLTPVAPPAAGYVPPPPPPDMTPTEYTPPPIAAPEMYPPPQAAAEVVMSTSAAPAPRGESKSEHDWRVTKNTTAKTAVQVAKTTKQVGKVIGKELGGWIKKKKR